MRFDWPTGDDFQPDGQPAAVAENDRPMVPDGSSTARIAVAVEKTREWAIHENDNPTGRVLCVKLDFGEKYRPVWADIRAHWRGAIEAVCRAGRVAPPASGQDWDEKQLVGRWVVVETLQSVSKAGREYVAVTSWKPGPAGDVGPPVERRPARPSPAVRIQGSGADDIPF